MKMPPTFDRTGLEAAGFTGFVRFADLAAAVPRSPGVYAVLRDTDGPPDFLDLSVGGHFKGKDPTVPTDVLANKWIDRATVVYFGKAGVLSRRLAQFAAFGRGKPTGHWGGRYAWQLADHDHLLVAWLALPDGTDPTDAEHDLLDAFAGEQGALPFANINRGRTPGPATTAPAAQETRDDPLAILQATLGGRVYANVALCTGGWPEGTADHRIDAVLLPAHPQPGVVAWDDHADEFPHALMGADAYLAVARGYVDRPLLGLLLAATDMLSRSHPDHGLLRQVAVAEKVEANAVWLYDRRGIRIIRA